MDICHSSLKSPALDDLVFGASAPNSPLFSQFPSHEANTTIDYVISAQWQRFFHCRSIVPDDGHVGFVRKQE